MKTDINVNKLDLQFFADETDTETTETTTEETKTYTQEEVMQMLQKEADKRVTQALTKQKKQYEQKLSLSGLDEQERAKKEAELRIQELEEKLKSYNTMETRNEITKVLSSRGLNPQFAELIEIGEDVEEAQQRIDTLDKLFKEAVKTEVEKRLNTSVPKTSTVGLDGSITKEDFRKMSIVKQQELYRNNPELYKKLSN
jgi:NADH:ubiquinone oxidoreductase subunit C